MSHNKYHNKEQEEKIRLDKWLWCARFYKTRSLAHTAITQGKVTCNGQKINPSKLVQLGITLSVNTALYERVIVVKAIVSQRQNPRIAQTLYKETPESLERKEIALIKQREQKWLNMSAPCPITKPNKHSRKKMRGLKRKQEMD